MAYEFVESDWKLFKKRLPEWQENYMDMLNKEYIRILSGAGLPSEKYWKVYHRYKKDMKSSGVMIRDKEKSQMIYDIMNMLHTKAITLHDLDGFSQNLLTTIYSWMDMVGRETEVEES